MLYSEQVVTIAPDGRITTTKNYAVRILNRDGREYANAVQMYLTGSSKVRDMRAWLIRGSGDVKKYGKENTLDQISDPNDIYNEYRVRIITAEEMPHAGMVFGYQSTMKSRSSVQDLWRFQSRLPTLLSRYTLALPAGWRASSVTFNHAKIEPTVTAGSTYTWELRTCLRSSRSRAAPSDQPRSAHRGQLLSRRDGSPVTGTKTFSNWADVSRWATELNDPQTAMDDTLAAKARELTANSKTELERIQAIARFVQNLQYISIDIGVGRERLSPASRRTGARQSLRRL